ncbi:hypothetical protein ACIRU5_35645 [Streptomyces misionensis]|uniref:hypothetical protein n=1 Tax=Streptomyces misionensis TaxID=67331 RepID=UPI0037F2675B
MADRSMEHLTVPDARSPEQQGADVADPKCILPRMLMGMAGKLAILATDVSLRGNRDAAAVIRSIGGQ